MEKMRLLPPPIVALLLLGLAFLVDRWLPGLPRLRLPTAGLILMAAGFSLGILALHKFRLYRTTFVPHGEPTALVTAGPYSWTRNPMYLGLFTLLLGLALYFGHLPLFLIPAAFFFIIDRAHIPHEEAILAKLFGDKYSDYRSRVGRWL